MMEKIEARGDALGAAAADAVRERLVDAIDAAVPGVTVSVSGEDVTIAGRGLARRMLDDPALRWIGGLLR